MSGREQVIVLGAGGHARVVLDTLRAAGRTAIGVYDDTAERQGTSIEGILVRGPLAAAARVDAGHEMRGAICAVGDNRARARICAAHDGTWAAALVHPSAVIAPSATLGVGTVVFAGAVVQPGAVIGAHVIVNTGATIDHDCTLGDFVHVAPGAHLCGGVAVGEGALLAVGCAVAPGVRIGAWSVVGAGAAVVADVAAGTTVVGVPARTTMTADSR